ncbi:MAG: potassium channel family protein [Fidelibacterota bacterium]
MSISSRFNSIVRFYQLLKREKILRLLIVIAILVFVGSFGVTYFEKNTTFLNALWWSFVTLTTVGYGDIAPVTLGGRIIGIIMMFFGIGVLGLFTATIASIFVNRKFKEERGMFKTDVKDHFVICGWNHRASEIVHSLRVDPHGKRKPIVLLADIDTKPVEDEDIYFIQGEVTEENLNRANIKEAKTVIILLDDRLDVYTRDAKAILNTLTVESMNPDVYTCVELVNSENIEHCKRARADEVIVGEEFSSKLLTQAAINHGITMVISEILSKKYGSNLYKVTIPDFLKSESFVNALTLLKRDYNCLIVAVQSSSKDVFMTNPSADYIMQNGDQIILISDRRPEF